MLNAKNIIGEKRAEYNTFLMVLRFGTRNGGNFQMPTIVAMVNSSDARSENLKKWSAGWKSTKCEAIKSESKRSVIRIEIFSALLESG